VEIANDRPWPSHQDTTDLDGAIPRQQLSSSCSPLSPSPSCRQASPEPLACPLVALSELTKVTDLLALFAGVVSTTPVVVSTWPTLLTTPSSEDGVVVGTVPVPTQRLNHAFGGPPPPSRHMSVASSVTTPLEKSSGHERGDNRSPSPQGAKGKDAMEIDGNDLGHLSYGLELDDINLPHSTIVRNDHDLVSEGDGMQEDLSYQNDRVLTSGGRLYGEVDAAQDGQSSQRSEVVTRLVLDSAMELDSTYLHDLDDVDNQQHDIHTTKARKRTKKTNRRSAGKSKSERRQNSAVGSAYGSQDQPKWLSVLAYTMFSFLLLVFICFSPIDHKPRDNSPMNWCGLEPSWLLSSLTVCCPCCTNVID